MSSSQTKAAGSSNSTQLSVVQILHQEKLARLASVSLPKLASQHSRTFVHMARSHLEASQSLYEGQKLSSVRYRKALWSESVTPLPARSKDNIDRVVPDFYHLHNPRCRRCALPLIAGLNSISRALPPTTKRKRAKTNTRQDARTCSLCQMTRRQDRQGDGLVR